ncbi:hypothetical protein MMPV_003019 [Pyropia vietnamensis]
MPNGQGRRASPLPSTIPSTATAGITGAPATATPPLLAVHSVVPPAAPVDLSPTGAVSSKSSRFRARAARRLKRSREEGLVGGGEGGEGVGTLPTPTVAVAATLPATSEVYDVDEGALVPPEAASGGAPAGPSAGTTGGAPAAAGADGPVPALAPPAKVLGRKAAKRKRAEERAAATALAAAATAAAVSTAPAASAPKQVSAAARPQVRPTATATSTAVADALIADILRPSDTESDGGGGEDDSSDGSSGTSAAERRRRRRQQQQQRTGSSSGALTAGRAGDDSDGDGAYGPLRYTAAPGSSAYLDVLMAETPTEVGRGAASVATALAAARKAKATGQAGDGGGGGRREGSSAAKRRKAASPHFVDFMSLDADKPAHTAGVAAAADEPVDVDNPELEDGQVPSDGVAPSTTGTPADDGPWDESTVPPWIISREGADAVAYAQSPTVSLHYEVLQFANFMAPTTAEEAAREALVTTLRRVIRELWPAARVELFGSYATRLYLPTSDVDVCIMGAPDEFFGGRDRLETVAAALERVPGLVRTVRIIRARVPLVKLIHAASGVACDISFDQANGPTNVPVIRRYLHAYPALHPLLLVVKAFLYQRGLNEVFTGGLSSYSVLLLVVSHLQTLRFNFPMASADLGDALITFFTLYGRLFNVAFASIAVGDSPAPGYRVKSRRWAPADGDTLRYSMEDPNDLENELGRNSYAAARIRKVFSSAASALGRWRRTGASVEHPTPLSTIIFADPQLVDRREVVRHDRE